MNVRLSGEAGGKYGDEARLQVLVEQQLHDVATSLACSRSAA
jgi:hypothetical protein